MLSCAQEDPSELPPIAIGDVDTAPATMAGSADRATDVADSDSNALPAIIEVDLFPPPTEDEFEQAVADGLWPPSGSQFMSNGGTFFFDVQVTPDPIPLNDLFELKVTVLRGSSESGLPADVEITVDARMPEHRHGMNLHPTVVRRGGGRFHVTGMLLHMPGYWEILFDIILSDSTERAQMAVFLD